MRLHRLLNNNNMNKILLNSDVIPDHAIGYSLHVSLFYRLTTVWRSRRNICFIIFFITLQSNKSRLWIRWISNSQIVVKLNVNLMFGFPCLLRYPANWAPKWLLHQASWPNVVSIQAASWREGNVTLAVFRTLWKVLVQNIWLELCYRYKTAEIT